MGGGVGWKGERAGAVRQIRTRHVYGEEEIRFEDLVGRLTEELGGVEALNQFGGSLVLSRGWHMRWESPETDAEMAERVAWEKHRDERQEEWERAMYERLVEKYGAGGSG